MNGSFAQWGDALAEVVAGGFDRLAPSAEYMCYVLAVLAVAVAVLGIMKQSGAIFGAAMGFLLTAGFYLTVVENLPFIVEKFTEICVKLGLLAGNSGQNAAAWIRSPEKIFYMGLSHVKSLYELSDKACEAGGYLGCLGNFNAYWPVALAAAIVFLTFLIVPCMVFAALGLLAIGALAATALLPLGIFSYTASYAGGPIKLIVHSGVQLFVLMVVTSVGSMVFAKMTLGVGDVPGLAAAIPYICASLIFLSMVLGSSGTAYVLVSGGMPKLGAVGTGAGMAATAARSAAGHLDGPATAGAKAAANQLYGAAKAGHAQSTEAFTRALAARRGNA